jgi:hypothetical protein
MLYTLAYVRDWVTKQVAGKPGTDPKTYWHCLRDQFLSSGGPSIPLVRRAMLGSEQWLAADQRPD